MISSHLIFISFHMEITLRLWCSCLLSDLVKHDLTMVCTGSAGSAFDSSFSGGWCRNFPSRWHVSKCFISKPSKLFLQTLFHFATKKHGDITQRFQWICPKWSRRLGPRSFQGDGHCTVRPFVTKRMNALHCVCFLHGSYYVFHIFISIKYTIVPCKTSTKTTKNREPVFLKVSVWDCARFVCLPSFSFSFGFFEFSFVILVCLYS